MPELSRPHVVAAIPAEQEAWMNAWIVNDRSGTFFLTDVWRANGDSEWQVIARYSSYGEPQAASATAMHAATR